MELWSKQKKKNWIYITFFVSYSEAAFCFDSFAHSGLILRKLLKSHLQCVSSSL